MSQIMNTDSLTYPIPDHPWDLPLFPPTLNVESFTPDYPHRVHPHSLQYSISSIGNTSSQPTNHALGMRTSPDFRVTSENGQLCLPTHQVFELPLTSHTPAVSPKHQSVLPLHVLICVSIQIPLSSYNTQFESHRENMLPPSRDFSVPTRLQGSYYANMVDHGMVDNYSLPPDVSNFYLSDSTPPLSGK